MKHTTDPELAGELDSTDDELLWIGAEPRWGLEEASTRESVAQRLLGRSRSRSFGRFELGERLGRGGMGEVWAARDPRLDRDVALKTLRVRPGDDEMQKSRLLEEARSLARLRHPNVVAVHDTLEIDGLLVIVMERVEGDTLASRARSGRVALEALGRALHEAGRGISAAHEAGIVHLDFKPANVLLDARDQVRVVDFGLARRVGDDSQLAWGGTPGYAAPEQWKSASEQRGQGVDARADQFAFAATYVELLGKCLPFGSLNPGDLDEGEYAAQLSQALRRPGIPTSARAPLRRALARDSRERFADFPQLLDALFVAPRRRRGLVGGVAAVLGVLALGAGLSRVVATPPPCAGVTADQWLSAVWSPEQRAGLLDAARARGGLVVTAESADRRMQARRASLEQLWPSLCEVELVSNQDRVASRHRACVEERRVELERISARLAGANLKLLENASRLVQELPAVEDCRIRAQAGLEGAATPSLEAQMEAREISGLLADARAYRASGEIEARREASARAASRAEASGDPLLIARARQQAGHLAVETGEMEEGLGLAESAYHLALEAGDDLLAADTANLLVFLTGARGRRPDRAQNWIAHTDSLFARLDVDATRRVRFLSHQGATAASAGERETSLTKYQEALDLYRASELDAPSLEIVVLNGIAIGLEINGDGRGAIEHYKNALANVEAELGVEHPRYGALSNNYGSALQSVGETSKAVDQHRRAVTIAQEAGLSRREMSAQLNLCFALSTLRQREAAPIACQRAVDLCLGVFDRDEGRCSDAYMGLGNALVVAEDGPGALAAYQRTFDTYLADVGEDDPAMAWAWSGLGAGHLASHDHAEAKAAYERAASMGREAKFPVADMAEINFGLARARHQLGEHSEALTLARQASAGYAEGGQGALQAEVDRWLAEHDLEP